MSTSCRFFLMICVLLAAAGASGCRQQAGQVGSAEPQAVTVSLPVVRDVGDYVDFTGRTEAVESVDIRARVTGYLNVISFRDGSEVKKGVLLFNIDPLPLKAQYDAALAQVKVCEASVVDRRANLERAKTLLPTQAITQEEYDRDVAAFEETTASLAAAQANAEAAKLNLDFATIASPIDGRISRTNITVGNLIRADDTLLTTIVSQDPMYVYFDVDEPTLLRVTRMLLVAKENVVQARKLPVLVGLADEEGYPHEGYLDFANNEVDSSTGTVTSRGVFSNPAAPSGFRLLRPGMFVRVRLPLGEPRKVALVAERALGTDQGKKYLLVVDDQSMVQYRPVEVGPLQDDGLRAIPSGLRPDERVIVSGLQLVRPKMKVQPEEAPMPTLGGVGRAAAQPAGAEPAGAEPAGAAPKGTAPSS